MMKASEIREMSVDEMRRNVVELKEKLFNLRFQHEVGQLENSQMMKKTKRNIARIKTIINESVKQNITDK